MDELTSVFQVVLNQLLERGIDLLSPAPVLELRGSQGTFETDRHHSYTFSSRHYLALIKMFQYVENKQAIMPSILECQSLLLIHDIVKWDVGKDQSGGLTIHRREGPRDNVIYSRFRSRFYNTYVFGEYRNDYFICKHLEGLVKAACQDQDHDTEEGLWELEL